MDINLWNNILNELLKNHTYSLVVGYWMGHFLYLVIWDSFDRNIEKIGEKMDPFHKVLCLILVILSVYTLYHGLFGCFAWTFWVSGMWLWWSGFYKQHGTSSRKRLYIKRRLDLYGAMNDEDLIIETILYRVDKHFGGLLGKISSAFFKLLPALVTGLLGMHYDSVVNFNKEALEQYWEVYCKNIEMVSVIISFTIFSMVCAFINYTELKTRQHAVEYHFEARGLTNLIIKPLKRKNKRH